MKSIVKFLFSIIMLVAVMNPTQAQTNTPIPVPNGNFENWSNGNGYSIPLLITSITVFEDFTYPTNWNYPVFPLNYPVSIAGMTYNLNADMPLLKVTHETSDVSEGNSALKMQSFMLSDLVNSTIYNLVAPSLDSALTTAVIPTILSTGNIRVDQLLPLLSSLSGDMGDMMQLLLSLMGEDINNYIEGGIPMNGLVPSQLTGQYKYTSGAAGGDNGGVLLLGTKYNTTTHRRELVGGGISMDLTEAATYTSFEVPYMSLGGILPTIPASDPDSLVIFLVSSISAQSQQGSALYVDNLQLLGHEPDPSGVDALANNGLLCYPSPAHGECTLQFQQQKPTLIQLYSIDGKLLQQLTPSSENISLSLPYAGIFMLRCETEQGVIIKKIINQ